MTIEILNEVEYKISNQLAIILGSADLIKDDTNLTDDQREKLKRISDSCHNITKILREQHKFACT